MNPACADHFKCTSLQISAFILASAEADSIPCMISSAVPDLASVNKECVALHPPQISRLLTFLLSLRPGSGFGSGMVIPSFSKLAL